MLYKNCFSEYGDAITEQGYIYREDLNINMSSIYSRLIQEAGRFCDHYASDIIYDINGIEKRLRNQEAATVFLGFRESGVDHTDWVMCKDSRELASVYRTIWRVVIEFAEDDYYDKRVDVSLCRVTYNSNKHYFESLRRNANV